MGNYERGGSKPRSFGGKSGGRPDFQKKSWGNDRGDMPMHKATCSDCQKTCEVPFRPSGIKPVFCKECFAGKRDSDDRGGRDFNDRGPKRDFNDRATQSFSKPAGMNDDSKRQLDGISMKLDRLITAIEKMQDVKKVVAVPFTAPTVKVIAPMPVVETKKVTASVVAPAKKAEVKTVAKKVVAKKVAAPKVVAKKKK